MKKICDLWRRFKYRIEKMRLKRALIKFERNRKAANR